MTLTPSQVNQTNERRQRWPLVWLVEIPIPDEVSPQKARLTSYSEEVEFGTDTSGNPIVYTPRQLRIEPLRTDTKATQQTFQLTLSNANQELLALVDQYDGLENVEVRIMLVSTALLEESIPLLDQRAQIIGVTAQDESLAFELGRVDLTRSRFPANRVQSDHCSFPYKGSRCGYTGGLASCDKTLNGPNGCEVHDNAVRFGGFPGVPRP